MWYICGVKTLAHYTNVNTFQRQLLTIGQVNITQLDSRQHVPKQGRPLQKDWTLSEEVTIEHIVLPVLILILFDCKIAYNLNCVLNHL